MEGKGGYGGEHFFFLMDVAQNERSVPGSGQSLMMEHEMMRLQYGSSASSVRGRAGKGAPQRGHLVFCSRLYFLSSSFSNVPSFLPSVQVRDEVLGDTAEYTWRVDMSVPELSLDAMPQVQ